MEAQKSALIIWYLERVLMLNYNNITNDFKDDKSSVKVSLAKYYSYEKNDIIQMGKMRYLISRKKNMKLLCGSLKHLMKMFILIQE